MLFVKVQLVTVSAAALLIAPPEVFVFDVKATFVADKGALAVLVIALDVERVSVIPLMNREPKFTPIELLVIKCTVLFPSSVRSVTPGPVIVRLSAMGVFI